MVAVPEKINTQGGETERIIDAFKQQILQSLEKDKSRLKEIAEQDAKQILARAYQESSQLTSKAREDSLGIIEAAKAQANSEVEKILTSARTQAEQILVNAEDMVRRDAKEKTRREIEKLMNSSRDESAKLRDATVQSARNEADGIVAEAKKEATRVSRQLIDEAEEKLQQILTTAREDARAKAEREASQILVVAKADAQKEKEELIAHATIEAQQSAEIETRQIISKAKLEADEIIGSAKNKVRLQLEESSRLMMEMQQKMQQVLGFSGVETAKSEVRAAILEPEVKPIVTPKAGKTAPPKEESAKEVNPVEPVHKAAKVTNSSDVAQAKIDSIFGNDETRSYQGRLKIDIAPPVDPEQMSILEQNLLKNPELQLVGKGSAEDGSAWIEVEISKPLPLVAALRKIPGVKDVVGAKSYIIVALRAKQLV
jgi:vacuolar-type H+-ATPase subunit H